MQQNDIISGKMSSDIENMDWSMGTTTAQLPNVRYEPQRVHSFLINSIHFRFLFIAAETNERTNNYKY